MIPLFSQVNRPLTMKKEGIQTRNRKVSNKNKKSKKATMLEPYSDVGQPLDDNAGPFSLGPGTLLTYSHTPHLIPTPSSLHPSGGLPYPHHLNTGIVPTMVWHDRAALYSQTSACFPVCHLRWFVHNECHVNGDLFSLYLIRQKNHFVDIVWSHI